MSTSIFMRGVGSLALTWGVMACAPDAPADHDTTMADSVAATDPGSSAETAAVAAPSSTDSVSSSAIAPTSATGSATGRAAVLPPGGRDSVIMPDFADPSKRLPPAVPDSGSR